LTNLRRRLIKPLATREVIPSIAPFVLTEEYVLAGIRALKEGTRQGAAFAKKHGDARPRFLGKPNQIGTEKGSRNTMTNGI
jgi:hypothetical protein